MVNIFELKNIMREKPATKDETIIAYLRNEFDLRIAQPDFSNQG